MVQGDQPSRHEGRRKSLLRKALSFLLCLAGGLRCAPESTVQAQDAVLTVILRQLGARTVTADVAVSDATATVQYKRRDLVSAADPRFLFSNIATGDFTVTVVLDDGADRLVEQGYHAEDAAGQVMMFDTRPDVLHTCTAQACHAAEECLALAPVLPCTIQSRCQQQRCRQTCVDTVAETLFCEYPGQCPPDAPGFADPAGTWQCHGGHCRLQTPGATDAVPH